MLNCKTYPSIIVRGEAKKKVVSFSSHWGRCSF